MKLAKLVFKLFELGMGLGAVVVSAAESYQAYNEYKHRNDEVIEGEFEEIE